MDEELIEAMWQEWAKHATPKPFDVLAAMRAVLAVVREHDGDATRCPGCDHQRLAAGEHRRDAERYRWLREHRLHPMSHPNGDAWGMSEVIYGDDIDAAIDAARGKE